MLLFSIGSDTSSNNNTAVDGGSTDDSKPNSLYGGSVRQQSSEVAVDSYGIVLQDLSPDRTAVSTGENESVSDLGMFEEKVPSPEEFGFPDSGYGDDDAYVFESYAVTGENQLLAKTTTSRWARKWGGAFDVPSDNSELGGGESAAGYGSRVEDARRLGERPPLAMRHNNSSMSSMSVSSGSVGSSTGLVLPRHAGMTNRMQTRNNGRMARRHGLALKSASDLLDEVFPEGVPSQGVLKAGVECIEADVRFQMLGNGNPLPAWHGFIVDGVLFVYVSEFCGTEQDFRSAVMALMELAEDVLTCSSVIVALPRALQMSSGDVLPTTVSGGMTLDTAAAASLVRAFMYSGFEMVSPMLYCPSPAYILVGYDAM
ncbi:hypothetical protein COEREDRAFT_15997 [Coemansia reversa NRRL 1564]|uniref:Ornithine decarboxylase antizyme n=1 Tax=Coemansia reversa (strain ATCC 12441 / NRRL 1564) TaxID=763665 RepID=A0A2G5B9N9_COERN|nr:hypothetical protein COEREDRAFT_15997 [Coemansia reversa NRRL 1564]|eukprot:PIA15733.1 hypothetical protein COEREDRAFT_15997 [Coemansia reversa NRRL 1564]